MLQITRRWVSALPALALLACASPAHKEPAPVSREAISAGSDGHLSESAKARLRQQGYWLARRDAQIVYCRIESVTGTMISHTVCLTELQLRQQAETAQQSRDVLHQPLTPRCLGSVCPAREAGM